MTVIAGPDHTREPRSPVPMSGRPGSDLGERRGTPPRCRPPPVHSSRRRPSTATSPCSSCSVASARMQGEQRVGRGAAVLAAVLGPASVSTSTVTFAMPRSADR